MRLSCCRRPLPSFAPDDRSLAGSLSGAGLLHFLQRCASDVDLASKATLKGVTSPSSTFSAGASIPADQLAAYIEAYFTIFHIKYPLVHQATFRAQLGDIVPRTGGAAWTLLHTAVLGLGSMCVSGDSGDGSETLCLYDKAVAQVSAAMFDTSSLTAVQVRGSSRLSSRSRRQWLTTLTAGIHASRQLESKAQPRLARHRLPRHRFADGDQPRAALRGVGEEYEPF